MNLDDVDLVKNSGVVSKSVTGSVLSITFLERLAMSGSLSIV